VVLETNFFNGVLKLDWLSTIVTRDSSMPLASDRRRGLFAGLIDTWDGLKFGLSGLDTRIVILEGLGETDLNQTVLFSSTWSPTWEAEGSLGGKTLVCTRVPTLLILLLIAFGVLFHWKKLSVLQHWQVAQCFPSTKLLANDEEVFSKLDINLLCNKFNLDIIYEA
jgi:hypothetical protein